MPVEGEGAEGTEEINPDDVELAPETQDNPDDVVEVDEGDEVETPAGDETEVEDDGEIFRVKIDGEEFEVTLDELLNGYSRQADYTRKTQELASQRQRFEAFERLETAFADDPQGTIEALARAYQVQMQPGDTPDLDGDLDPVEQRLAEMEARWQRQQEAEALRVAREAVDREMATLAQSKSLPADFDWDSLFRFAVDRDIKNLEDAYDLWSVRNGGKTQERRAEVLERKRKAPKVAGGTRRASGSTVRQSSARPTLEEAFAEAFAEHTS